MTKEHTPKWCKAMTAAGFVGLILSIAGYGYVQLDDVSTSVHWTWHNIASAICIASMGVSVFLMLAGAAIGWWKTG